MTYNYFATEIYKNGNLLNSWFIIDNTSKLVIKYKNTTFEVEEFYIYLLKKGGIFDITYIIKDISFKCTDIEFIKKGKTYISRTEGVHSQKRPNCNYIIIKPCNK